MEFGDGGLTHSIMAKRTREIYPGEREAQRRTAEKKRQDKALEDSKRCPLCSETTAVVKNGRDAYGTQRYYCKTCKCCFTQRNVVNADRLKEREIIIMRLMGVKPGAIKRTLKTDYKTINKTLDTYTKPEIVELFKQPNECLPPEIECYRIEGIDLFKVVKGRKK